ncbi:hypothetical protein N8J89_40510 [Crossiella sp. CA-258035]|uniref:hypothetical protein n=1 Tax=Crossiella sp. CA-258035 TaxID=2981138 RepID=UPI0024BCFC60|nr:hypothetical protein [Crossiella sp. CA-258035]WHT19302.1 hypothetical protein N8J89_40510 [Crossiella sp. CA-258035]
MSTRRGALPLALAALTTAACTPAPAPPTPLPPAPTTSTVVRFGDPPGTGFGAELALPSGTRFGISEFKPVPQAELTAEERMPGTRVLLFTVTVTNPGKAPLEYPDPSFYPSFVAHGSDEVVRPPEDVTDKGGEVAEADKPIPPGGSVRVEHWIRLPDRPGVLQLKAITRDGKDEFRFEGEV